MKKIASILVLVFFTIASNAQSLIPIKYGIKAGLNISNINSTASVGVKNIETSSKIGIAGGFYMEIALNDQWYINPELLFSQKGASFTYNYTHDSNVNKRDEHETTNELILSYVELNPTISFKASNKLSLNFGPSIAFLISDDYTQIDSDETISNDLTPAKFDSESLDIALNLGLSYYFTEHFLVDARVNTGLITIGEASKLTSTGLVGTTQVNYPKKNKYELKNRAIVFSIAYLF